MCPLSKHEDASSIPRIHVQGQVSHAPDTNTRETETGGSLGLAGYPAGPTCELQAMRDATSKTRCIATEGDSGFPYACTHMCFKHEHTCVHMHLHKKAQIRGSEEVERPWVSMETLGSMYYFLALQNGLLFKTVGSTMSHGHLFI